MILLLGSTGYIGQAFAAELRRRGLPFEPLSRATLDYSRLDALFNYVRNLRPDFIINAAGLPGRPNIDACETARADAVHANTLLPQTIARVCYLTKTPWGHVSSGCIYTGARVGNNGNAHIERDLNRPEVRRLYDADPAAFSGFTETDEPNFSFRTPPCNFYSGTKALAEEGLHWFDQTYLWRPRSVFDETNHPRNLLSKLQAYEKIQDNVNSISHRGDFVRACLDLWDRRAPFGTYNIVNPGALTSRQIIEAIQRILKPARKFEFWKDDDEFYRHAAVALRANCILDPSKLLATGIKMRPVQEALEDALENWQTTPGQELKNLLGLSAA